LLDGIDPRTQFRNHAAIDFHPAGGNQFFALPAAASPAAASTFCKRCGPLRAAMPGFNVAAERFLCRWGRRAGM